MRRLSLHSKLLRIGLGLSAVAFGLVFFGTATKNTPETGALSATEFKDGRIMDDSIFYNSGTMTVAQIQSFLDSKSPACDMWGTGAVGGGRYINGRAIPASTSRADYARQMRAAGNSRYHDPPYVCVNKYYENPTTHRTLYESGGRIEPGMISAAQIIHDMAKQYGVNPQVLLVLLKKESYVWGDNWPLKWQYNTVMGYGCPDGSPCDSEYFGFYNQVKKSAWQLKRYKDNIYSYSYRPYVTNNIQYKPYTNCGTKAVYLENIATTSLYIYTPYVPNAAALRNYPGEGDGCSSYGNRNFYMYFREWFGNTLGGVAWENMTSPRVMTVKQDTLKVNAGNNSTTSQWLKVGESYKFTSKTSIYWGGELMACLRTEADTKNGQNTCVLMPRMTEYAPKVTKISASNKYASKQYTCLVDLQYLNVACGRSLDKGGEERFTATVTIGGVKYLTWDNNTRYGYIAGRFYENPISLQSYGTTKLIASTAIAEVRDLDLKVVGRVAKNEALRIIGTAKIQGNTYLVGKSDGAYRLLLATNYKDGAFEDFQKPRELVAMQKVEKMNVVSGAACGSMNAKTAARFTTKITVEGINYYRTEADAKNGSWCAIKADDLKEVNEIFDPFLRPRSMKVARGAKKENVLSGVVCEEFTEDTVAYFNTKIVFDGKIYYRTAEDGDKGSLCGVVSTAVREL